MKAKSHILIAFPKVNLFKKKHTKTLECTSTKVYEQITFS